MVGSPACAVRSPPPLPPPPPTHTRGCLCLQERWSLRYLPTHPAQSGGYVDAPQDEDTSEYVAAGLSAEAHQASLDLVLVDGRDRPACMARALRLLKGHGGILVVDNSERPAYQAALEAVPGHWLRFDAESGAGATTTVFVSCREGAC